MMDLRPLFESLLSISLWPWEVDRTLAIDRASRINQVSTGDWIATISFVHGKDQCVANTAFIASSPLWLAEVVVGWVEERKQRIKERADFLGISGECNIEVAEAKAIDDFNLTPDLWDRLKARIGEARKTNEGEKL